jgi:hypothetical protein
MAWLSNTEHIWRYWGKSYDLPGDRLPTPGKSPYRRCEVTLHLDGYRVYLAMTQLGERILGLNHFF